MSQRMSLRKQLRHMSTEEFDREFQRSLSNSSGRVSRRVSMKKTGEPFRPPSRCEQLMLSQGYETFMGCIVVMNFLTMSLETNARAVGDSDAEDVTTYMDRLFLGIYIVESLARLYTMKFEAFKSVWNNLDFFMVLEGVLSEIMKSVTVQWSATNQMGMLKGLRMLRLLRLMRLLVAFQELYILVVGIGGCMKTLLWAACLIFMSLNVWSILSVEYLRRITEELEESGEYPRCTWCKTAFSNIWLANLTWFQIVSGDDWSALGRSMIENYPWTFIFFMTNIVIVTWGLLNLVVAAIVESSMQAREDDIASASKMAILHEERAFKRFTCMCKAMDKSGDGIITVDEFKEFWETNEELQQNLAVMGITEGSLVGLLKLMDQDHSGTLDHTEFVENFTHMRTLVVKTELFCVAKYIEHIHGMVCQHGRMLDKIATAVNAKVSRGDKHSMYLSSDSDSSTSQVQSQAPSSDAEDTQNQSVMANEFASTSMDSNVDATRLDLIVFVEELDKRFEAIQKQIDQLPKAITMEMLKSSEISSLSDVTKNHRRSLSLHEHFPDEASRSKAWQDMAKISHLPTQLDCTIESGHLRSDRCQQQSTDEIDEACTSHCGQCISDFPMRSKDVKRSL